MEVSAFITLAAKNKTETSKLNISNFLISVRRKRSVRVILNVGFMYLST